ncbi:hypothetical protein R6Q57_003763 [Mikania cordata]
MGSPEAKVRSLCMKGSTEVRGILGGSATSNGSARVRRAKDGSVKAHILVEKNKVIAELEAKKVVSKNTSKQDSIKESSDNCDEKGKSLHQGFIELNVGEEEASKAFHETTIRKSKRIKGVSKDCKSPYLVREVEITNRYNKEENALQGYILKWMFTTPKIDESIRLVALTKMMFEAVGRIENMRDLKSYDIVIIPILENNHFYVMAFDLKNLGIYLVDNMDKDETVVSIKDHQEYYKKDTPYKVKHMFMKYLKKFQHVKADKMSMQKVTRVDLEWATIGNIIDCGVFAMRHMEMFMGSNRKTFDCGFKTSQKQVKTQIQTLSKKYACRVLLSDINLQKQGLLAKVGL